MKNANELTIEQREEELRLERIAEKELDDTEFYEYIENVMKNIEDLRKQRLKELKKSGGVDKRYTQKDVAERAGISLSAYKSYLYGDNKDISHNISLITLLKITEILQCDLQDILP